MSAPGDVRSYWRDAPPWMRHADAHGSARELLDLHGADLERLPAGGAWLDFGCGGGAAVLVSRGRFSPMWLIDVSPASLHEASALATRAGIDHATAQDCSAVPSGSAAVLSCWSVLQHQPTPAHAVAILDDLTRVAAPRATLFLQAKVGEPCTGQWPACVADSGTMPLLDLRAALADHGWVITREHVELERNSAWLVATRSPEQRRPPASA